ncbi:MAG TPA: chromate transporter [Ruminococcaceae bacterium]|nr:chromate transporter [Oscillospiraceae bacterium]
MTLLLLCWNFFKTGLFAVGGGLATLPFLSDMAAKHPEWFTKAQLADMIAVAESTPGPIGVNMATFAGYLTAGVPGAILATCSLVLPSLIVLTVIARVLNKYMNNRFVKWAFGGLRPAVTGLIAAAGWSVVKLSLLDLTDFSWAHFWTVFNLPALAIFAVVLFLTQFKRTKKLHPIVLIAICAGIGIIFKL